MPYPPFSISEVSTYPATFEEDLAAYKAGGRRRHRHLGVQAPRDGDDARSVDALRASGLHGDHLRSRRRLAFCPISYFREPRDPVERRKALCASVRRFAAFNPVGVMVRPRTARRRPRSDRRMVVEGVKAAADMAGEVGVDDRVRSNPQGRRLDHLDLAGNARHPRGHRRSQHQDHLRHLALLGPAEHSGRSAKIRRSIHLHSSQRPAQSAQLGRQTASGRWRSRPAGLFRGAGKRAASRAGTTSRSSRTTACGATHYPDSLYNLNAAELAKRAVAGFRKEWDKRRRRPKVSGGLLRTGAAARPN